MFTPTEGFVGQALKGYFNAVPTVKLGILTDGIIYELYSDTGLENMMDDEPFIRVDLSEVEREGIDDQALDALSKLRKGTFDPADVGADAKRKIYVTSYVDALEKSFKEPGEALVKALMDLASIEGRRTGRWWTSIRRSSARLCSCFSTRKSCSAWASRSGRIWSA